MPFSDDGLKKELLETDDEFRRLYQEHQNYERRLDEIHERSFASPEDEHEVKQIKLHKLSLKDQMAQILRSHRQQRAAAPTA